MFIFLFKLFIILIYSAGWIGTAILIWLFNEELEVVDSIMIDDLALFTLTTLGWPIIWFTYFCRWVSKKIKEFEIRRYIRRLIIGKD